MKTIATGYDVEQIKKDEFHLRLNGDTVIKLSKDDVLHLRQLFSKCLSDNVVCKYCGAGNLNWKKVIKGDWRLFHNDKLHDCPVRPLPELISDIEEECDWI